LVIVKAPPGSGKSYLIRETAAYLWSRKRRVAIAAQTNSQTDDLSKKLGEEFGGVQVVRFHGSGTEPKELGANVVWAEKPDELPSGPCIVVGTTAKWGLVSLHEPFDFLLVDEAWQMAWADFMLLGQVAPRFVMVGDPGQIDPVVTIDVSRWATARVPPQAPAPDLLLGARATLPLLQLELPASRRLPADSVEIVNGFYDFPFESWAGPKDRRYKPAPAADDDGLDRVIDRLRVGSIAVLTLPTPPAGPPLEQDVEVAETAARLAARMLNRGAELEIDGRRFPLGTEHIGMSATHRIMNARMEDALGPSVGRDVMVDTPERWQGLERPVMVVVHPISGETRPSGFDLETGRLCVMASRHQVGVVVVTRDHVAQTLEEMAPLPDQAVGLPDRTGSGLERHRDFWASLLERQQVVSIIGER
jgi:hypothetical protein